mmetsp:Transcript_36281/g.40487  ORF Transcript_36281/g.40487 Transcript_36281/m.40487 type:complete len:84 (+) Transcript_36281:258-509(+)
MNNEQNEMMMMMKQKHQLLGEEGGVLMTEDLNTIGNDEVYIVFMEDSATLTTEGTDDDAAEDGVMITIMRRIHRHDGHPWFGQ